MVAEKQICHIRAFVRGASGHGSLATNDGAMGRLARVLDRLERFPMPVHVTPVPREMFQAVASHVSWPAGFALRRLLNPSLTNPTLKLMGDKAVAFDPLLRHTVNATMVRGGQSVNMAPGESELLLDGRLLPGFIPGSLLGELQTIVGEDVSLEVIHHDPGPAKPDMGLFDTLAGVLREADLQGVPVPMLLPGSTDARFFSRLGIQTYGFLPMNLPSGFRFPSAVHGIDEGIPVESLSFGADAIFHVLRRLGRG